MTDKRKEKGMKSLKAYLESSGKFLARSEYKSYSDKMDFECTKCQYLWRTTPFAVQQGKSCPACLGKVLTVDNLQSKIDDSGKSIKVLDVLGRDGEFLCSCNICSHVWKTRSAILFRYNSSGCPMCSKKVRGTVEKLQAMFIEHGNNVEVVGQYVNNSTPIECRCLDCSEVFYPIPTTVIYGSGCPFCCFKGRIPAGPASLYYARVNTDSDVFWKIGITSKSNIIDRFPPGERKKIIILYSYLFSNGHDAYLAEKNILRIYKQYLAKDVQVLDSGNTELFSKDVLQMNHLGIV